MSGEKWWCNDKKSKRQEEHNHPTAGSPEFSTIEAMCFKTKTPPYGHAVKTGDGGSHNGGSALRRFGFPRRLGRLGRILPWPALTSFQEVSLTKSPLCSTRHTMIHRSDADKILFNPD